MAVGGIGSFSALTSYSGVNSSKANSELEFDKIYQQKTDSVEINSTAGNNDIMTIYEMLCSEFPEANYILEDRSDEGNLFFNNVDTRIGKDFGNPSKKNVFIDVGVIKKIQEDPSYYLEAKLDLQQIIEHYDEARTHGGSDLPYTTGELDHVDLSESNLTTIYNNESDPLHDQLVEKRPTKFSYQFHFNYDKHNDDQSEDINWNTAIANEAFRKCWYYGLDLGSYYKRTNAINPYKCYNNAYTMQGLVYLSDGTEYTSLVQEKLGLPSYDGETMTRLDSAKFEEYKAQAIEELTAEGVTFPIHARYFVASGNQTALDSANVLKQAFSDSFGDDFIVLDIDSYVSSLSKEVRDPRRQSFVINGWGADYGDPQNYLGQETNDGDNAYYMVAYGHAVDNESEDLKALYDEFTELVNKANAITDDLDARYEAYADAEAFLIEHALTLPSNFDIAWELTHINDYNKQNAMFGIQNQKYKNWETSTDAYTAEDYAGFQETWNAGSAE